MYFTQRNRGYYAIEQYCIRKEKSYRKSNKSEAVLPEHPYRQNLVACYMQQ